jgi:hypothetical protein
MQTAGRLLALIGIALCLANSGRADARADFIAGNDAAAKKDWGEAAQAYMRVTAQLPKYAVAWKALASARYYMGDLEGAVASADRYLDLGVVDPPFAGWANGLRAKLKLPPRPTPVPTAAPTLAATPAPAPDNGILLAAPAPDAGAEAVPLEAAQELNAVAAEGAAATEQQAQVDAEAEMAADAARVKQARSGGPAKRGRTSVGLRLLGGWSLGLGRFGHGESVESSTSLGSLAYDAKPAQGGLGAVEALLGIGDHAELSLGAYPLAWSSNRDSAATSTVTRSNSSEANGLLVPLMLSAGWRQAVGQGWTLVLAGGAGLVPATRAHVKSQTVQTTASGLTVTTVSADYDYASALGWRAALGAEWKAGPNVSLYLGTQALGASFDAVAPTGTIQSVDAGGASVAVPSDVAIPSTQGLNVLSVGFMGGLTLRY